MIHPSLKLGLIAHLRRLSGNQLVGRSRPIESAAFRAGNRALPVNQANTEALSHAGSAVMAT